MSQTIVPEIRPGRRVVGLVALGAIRRVDAAGDGIAAGVTVIVVIAVSIIAVIAVIVGIIVTVPQRAAGC
jgi:hypothetical protein